MKIPNLTLAFFRTKKIVSELSHKSCNNFTTSPLHLPNLICKVKHWVRIGIHFSFSPKQKIDCFQDRFKQFFLVEAVSSDYYFRKNLRFSQPTWYSAPVKRNYFCIRSFQVNIV